MTVCRVLCLPAVILLLLCPVWSYGGEAGAPPQVPAHYVETPPKIDGRLDDPCWQSAPRLEQFGCIGIEQAPPEVTIAYICVDENNLYLAVDCQDRTPEDIVANETRRGGDLSKDDGIEFRLDPWHRHSEYYDCYTFSVNPNGAQAESIPGGSATKIEWRGDWQTAATRTPTGWQVEIAIPFAILPYPPGQESFGFTVTRRLHKEDREVYYPYAGREVDPGRTADLTGLKLPARARNLIVMPYFTLDLGEAVGSHTGQGVDVQYRLRNGLTALAALNPDFKQIEDVVEPLSFSYTEKYLDDPRPFFSTGQEGFLPNSDLLYTRRIEDFDGGLKLFGQVGRETIGLLDAVTLGEANSLAGRWGHQFSDDKSVSLSLVSHRAEGGADSLAYSLGGIRYWRDPRGFKSIWWGARQSQGEDSSGYAHSLGLETWHGEEILSAWVEFKLASQDFAPALGYFPETNYRGASFGFGWTDKFEGGALEERGWYCSGEYYQYLAGGGLYKTRLSPSYTWSWRNGRQFRLAGTTGQYQGSDNSDLSVRYYWNHNDIYRNGVVQLLRGKRAGGDYSYFTIGQGFKPAERLTIRFDLEYSKLTEPAAEAGSDYLAILTGSYTLSGERSVAARLIGRRAGLSSYFSFRQVVRRGMDMYVILGNSDPEQTGFTNRLVVKFIWAM